MIRVICFLLPSEAFFWNIDNKLLFLMLVLLDFIGYFFIVEYELFVGQWSERHFAGTGPCRGATFGVSYIHSVTFTCNALSRSLKGKLWKDSGKRDTDCPSNMFAPVFTCSLFSKIRISIVGAGKTSRIGLVTGFPWKKGFCGPVFHNHLRILWHLA